jgi:hypothetical protein
MYLMALALAAQDLPPQPMNVETFQDAITDKVSAFATLRDGDARLVVGCDKAGEDMRVTVHTDRWLVRGALFYGYRSFTYRLDQNRPRRPYWIPGDRSATLVARRRIVPFLRELAAARRLVVRMRDVEDNWFDTTFRLENVRPALEQVMAVCQRPDIARRVFGEG